MKSEISAISEVRENKRSDDRSQQKLVNLKKYYKRRLQKVDRFFAKKSQKLAPKPVHKVRVEIKKIDALFDIFESSKNNADVRRYFKPFRKLFKKAGKLRSAQVEYDLLDKYVNAKSDSNYLRHLRKIRQERKVEFRRFVENGIAKSLKLNGKKVIPLTKSVTKKDVSRYFEGEQKSIARTLEKKIFSEQKLHTVRKDLKRFYLNASNLTTYDIDARWKRLLNLLGEWHDRQEAFDQLIKAIYSGHLNKTESDHLKKIKTKLLRDKSRLFERIARTYTDENNHHLINKDQIKELSSS